MGLRDYLAGSSPEERQNEDAKLSEKVRCADTLFDEGRNLLEKRQYVAAINRFKKAQNIYIAERRPGELVDSGYNIAITLGDRLKRYRDAVTVLTNLVEFCRGLDWKADEIDLLLPLALYSLVWGDKETARKCYERALKLAEETDDAKRRTEVLMESQNLVSGFIGRVDDNGNWVDIRDQHGL